MFDKSGSTRLYNTLMGNPNAYVAKTNSVGRYAGSGSGDNFFTKKAKSIENALGTTGSALYSLGKDIGENLTTDTMRSGFKASINDIYRKYGFNNREDYDQQLYAAEDAGNQAEVDRLLNLPGLSEDLKAQANKNASEATEKAKNYENYRKNSYVGQKINQDRGKFLGSAINTMSTATDVLGLTNGPLSNAIQGGIEGIADELEQNGLKDFSWERAGQNALTGAASGAVTGALNNTGFMKNLGQGKISQAVMGSKLGQKVLNNGVGNALRAVGTGAARGAISGAVGGATGAGLSAAMNNQDVLGSALQGAKQGAISGAGTGAIMTGANMAINKTPGVGKFLRNVNQAQQDWKNSGDSFDERLTSTLTSGDSAVGEWLQGNRQSKLLGTAGDIGNRVYDIDERTNGLRSTNLRNADDMVGYFKQQTGIDLSDLVEPRESGSRKYTSIHLEELTPSQQGIIKNVAQKQGINLSDNGGYGTAFYFNKETPTTAGGWLKKAGQRIVEDVNNRGVGMIVKDVSGDGMLNLEKGDTLPLQARLKTLEEITDGQYRTIGDLIDDGMTIQDIKRVLPKRTYDELESEIRAIAEAKNPLEQISQYNGTSKSRLPQLNRQQYYEETIGKVGKDGLSYKDVPEYMQSHLSNNVARNNDEILRDFFKDNGLGDNTDGRYSTSELYEMYDRIANGPDANAIFTSENINDALDVMNRGSNKGISDRIGNRIFGDERRLKIEGGAGRKNNINVRNDNASWESDMAGRQDDAVANMMASIPEEMKMPSDVRNMRINNGTIPTAEQPQTTSENPAMAVYNRVAKQPAEAIDLTESFGDKGLGNIERRNKLQALGQQLQNSAKTQKYAPIYDSLDARTAKRAAETNAPQQLADLGVKPQDYNEYAKTSSYVNRVVSDLAKKSGIKVNAPDLPAMLSADNIDVIMSDSALKKYNGYIKQIVPDGDSPTQYSASYLLEKSREIGNKAANLRGNTDDVSALRQALTDAKYTLRDIATNALEGSLVTGDATNDMIAQGLKNLGANEKVQDYYTEAVDGKAPSVSDYIRRSALFEQARDMGTQVDAEKYTRSASKAPTRFATKVLRASGLEQPIETLLRNTVAPIASGITNVAGKAIEGAGNIVANRSGRGGAEAPNIQSEMPTNNTTMTTADVETYNPSMNIYNAIGRNEGRDNAQQARTADYLVNAAQEAEVVNDNTGVGATMNPQSTSLYNALYGQTGNSTNNVANGTIPTFNSIEEERAVYFFPPTGDYWSDMLSRAMRRAKNAEDYSAMEQLYSMYQDAVSSNAKNTEKDYSNPVNWNSTDRKSLLQAQNGLDQINSLESSYNNAVGSGGSNLIQGTLRQWSNNISGGNLDPSAENYVKQANSIGAGIIRNLVNLGSTEYDAQRYIDYLPKLTDTKEQAAQKLQVLRNAYENVIQNLRDVYSA